MFNGGTVLRRAITFNLRNYSHFEIDCDYNGDRIALNTIVWPRGGQKRMGPSTWRENMFTRRCECAMNYEISCHICLPSFVSSVRFSCVEMLTVFLRFRNSPFT